MADERPIRSSLSMTPSEPSSRSESPASSTRRNYGHHKSASSASERDDTPGLHRDDAYDRMLPSWRARVRRKLVELIGVESTIIARLQVCHKNKKLHFLIQGTDISFARAKYVHRGWMRTLFIHPRLGHIRSS